MGILAGIDEAGYGPHLGPLVVASAAIEFAAAPLPDPDLWESLAAHVCKRPSRGGTHVVICDSKVAYTSGGSLKTLERTVLGFLAAAGHRPRTFSELLRAMAAPAGPGSNGSAPAPWEDPEALRLPREAAPGEVDAAAGHLAAGLAAIGGRAAALRVSVASAARFNDLVGSGRNKAGALFALAADLLGEVLRRADGGPVHVVMDRHGGRRYYAQLLAGAFPMMPVEPIAETPGESRYRLARGEAPAEITVRERSESTSTATALASMAAKYVRELAMGQMNAYFRARVPGLRATAGYGTDAWRFLDDIAAVRAAAGVPDAAILRSR